MSPSATSFAKLSVPEITQQLLDSTHMMAASDIRSGKFLTAAAYFRGENVSSRAVEEAMHSMQQKVRHSSRLCATTAQGPSLTTVPPS